ncbi:hypothetical protein OEZ86_007418 [Tetradesmus obliquus]|nr:hypothetical protein OEZ86_007418 [Tetradesmus obliquus]
MSDSEEVILDEEGSVEDMDMPSGEEELDAYVHEEAAAGIPQADTDPASDDAGSPSPVASAAGSAVAAIAQETSAAAAAAAEPAAAPAEPEPAAAAAAPAEPAEPAAPEQPAAAAAAAAAEPEVQKPAAKPAGLGPGLGLGAGLGAPRGVGGMGLKPPAKPAAAEQPAPAAPAAANGRPGAVAASSAAAAAAAVSGVVDPEEPKAQQKLRQQVQALRVGLLRAAMRLGLSGSNEQLGQYLGVLERLEKVQAPLARARGDVNKLALQEAMERNEREAPDSSLGINLRIMVVGMTGTGKSELINSLMGRPVLSTSAFRDSTRRVRVVKGNVAGVSLTAIDTPGLLASSDAQSANRSTLKAIKRAYQSRKPHFVLYVDRLDAARPGFGEMSLLSNITATLGQKVWKQTLVVLTHANGAREKLGKEYAAVSKQRRNILQNILRQAAGEMQLRTPFHLVDLHPDCPRSASGQPLIFDQVGMLSLSAVPWRQNLLVMLLGLHAYESAQELLQKKAAKGKAAGGAKQQDMFKQMMRSRLPPTSYFVEQLVEGVTKPDAWAVPEDPFGAETDDEEAEEFRHIYYKLMLAMAKQGDPRAQKEYGAWLRRLDKAKKAYREAYDNEEIETLAAYGYEGYVAEGLDLGPSFDPEDNTDHRYQYVVADSPVSIMPTLDYYGFEHEDAITGFVAEYSAQPFNRDGWGGVPLDVTATIEKDKTTTCLQAEANASIVHSVAPFGSRHVTQVGGALELLRPNVKDILYTLEVNTFKDGLLTGNDHAGCGLMLTRMAEGGHIRKGPVGVGVRLQETMRVGPFKVEAVAAQVRGETPMGGRDEGWGARAFVLYDYIPGLAMNFDWYQERTKDESSTIGGWATALAYDFDLPGGYPAGVEVDWVSGGEIMHVDMNVFSARDWKLSWLLLLPFVNYAKDWIRRLRSRKGAEEEIEIEEEEEEEGGMMPGGADLAGMLQGMSGPDAQAMLQQLMQSGGLQQLMGGRG